jgi:hypothetical protein
MRIDRRIIFILIALAIAIPLLKPIGFPVHITKEVQQLYDAIDELPSGSVILVSFDCESATIPEMWPMALAVLRHSFRKDLKVIGMALISEGTAIGEMALTQIANEFNKKYGIDYVYLGYRPRLDATILGLGEDIAMVYPQDFYGNETTELSLMVGIRNYDDILLVLELADDSYLLSWIQFAGAEYHQRIVCGTTAVMATFFYPYLHSGQIEGLIGGLKGASEYEKLINKPGDATKGMDSQSVAHLLIILFIGLGNLAYYMGKRKSAKE